MVTTPNYKNGIGRLATDRYEFQNHIDGYNFNHEAGAILLNPALQIPPTSGPYYTTVQSALEAAQPYLVPTTFIDASLSDKGLIQLSRDIAGTGSTATNVIVCGLYGRPVLSTAPTSGYVLTWNGTAWEPQVIPSQFVATNDLFGTSSSQSVKSITGTTVPSLLDGYALIRCSHLYFGSTTTPAISQYSTSSTNGANLTIMAQTSTKHNASPGQVNISGGLGGDTINSHGGVRLQMGAGTHTLVHLAETASIGDLVLALVSDTPITSTNMPAGTGNQVIFIKDALTAPTTGTPVGGAILYSNSGILSIKQSNGTSFNIKPVQNAIAATIFHDEPYDIVSYLYETASTSYVEVFTTSTYTGMENDIIKAFFSATIIGKGFIKLSVLQGSDVSNHDMIGTETAFDTTDGYPIAISLVGAFKSVDDDTYYVRAMMKATTGTVYLDSAANLLYEAIRPDPYY